MPCKIKFRRKKIQTNLHRWIKPLTFTPTFHFFYNPPLPLLSLPQFQTHPPPFKSPLSLSLFKAKPASMAIDLVGFTRMDDRTAMEEAASAGLQSMDHLIRVLSNQNPSQTQTQTPLDCREITDLTVSKFKQLISVLNRTGHARFRRGPANQSSTPVQPVQPKPQTTSSAFSVPKSNNDDSLTLSPPISTTSSFLSSITIGDGSVSNGKAISSILAPPAPAFSAGKPPLSQSHRKRCHDDDVAAKTSSSGRCHCSKRRYWFCAFSVQDFSSSLNFFNIKLN